MTKFLLKCFFVTTVLFLGVLVGIQIASNNMVKMTGDSSYSTASLINNKKIGEENPFLRVPPLTMKRK
ncbi:DUF3679 domain-containing protein [Anaerobacillus sp. HL2]|nr:DUF3679 domain-containing protein [Anaerobacillus sp. HL2]